MYGIEKEKKNLIYKTHIPLLLTTSFFLIIILFNLRLISIRQPPMSMYVARVYSFSLVACEHDHI
jgi:hypothetical protein